MSSFIFLNIKDKIPSSSHYHVNEKIKSLNEEQKNEISMLELKNPIIGLVFSVSLGFFGADRFYKGNIGLGVGKLVIFVLYLLFLFLADTLDNVEDYEQMLTLSTTLFLIDFIWVTIDIFLVFKGIKKDNFEKISIFL